MPSGRLAAGLTTPRPRRRGSDGCDAQRVEDLQVLRQNAADMGGGSVKGQGEAAVATVAAVAASLTG